jgi:hypothetical protein
MYNFEENIQIIQQNVHKIFSRKMFSFIQAHDAVFAAVKNHHGATITPG